MRTITLPISLKPRSAIEGDCGIYDNRRNTNSNIPRSQRLTAISSHDTSRSHNNRRRMRS